MQHPKLQCDVKKLIYDFDTKQGVLHMDSGDCCDMVACIELFRSIDPDVRAIDTYSGSLLDTRYKLKEKGWGAYGEEIGAPASDGDYWVPPA